MNISSTNFRVPDVINNFKIGQKNSITEIDNQQLGNQTGLINSQLKSAHPNLSYSILPQNNS